MLKPRSRNHEAERKSQRREAEAAEPKAKLISESQSRNPNLQSRNRQRNMLAVSRIEQMKRKKRLFSMQPQLLPVVPDKLMFFSIWPAVQNNSAMIVVPAIGDAVRRLVLFVPMTLSRFSCCLRRRLALTAATLFIILAKLKPRSRNDNAKAAAPKVKSRSRSRGPHAAKPKPKSQTRRTETAKCNIRLAAPCV